MPFDHAPAGRGSGGPGAHDLRHHGDSEASDGLVDFAVNVVGDGPPSWLRDRLAATLDGLGRYPRADHDARARATVAARHGRTPEQVLPLAGSAEGFALLPALRPRLAAVVHPGFTEPEAALRAAGVPVTRVLTDPAAGHVLDPGAVPDEADLVVVGNPTNPTGVLHPAGDVRALARPGRVLLVDEAFADAVPGEPESLAGDEGLPGLLVFRSLTKTWALAGLRAGYALGAPGLLARLAAPRPPWPVSTPALEAIVACCEPEALSAADQRARELAAHRASMVAALSAIEEVAVQPGTAPFLLLHLPDGTGPDVRRLLREAGLAVRRGDTFPGLGPDHIRVAVRAPEVARRLVDELDAALRALAVVA
ncbi:threonine-phosphate decarboxylase [Pseudonocardia sp. C8]|uniref:Rv2231c family pyridoxal phosphate-dependent protein CobC n=1 Tax=Pseudonocardia sp. C8 TaxID=2762759 RepID=UPI0016427E67|nr:Rv2231c family pyridoxal phosphate-dependent protein CobC [Pseudonocardia sp. C8]MBC3191453.1 threonine-phosphate decarboxylase [Pseudonocardia sp. C8]